MRRSEMKKFDDMIWDILCDMVINPDSFRRHKESKSSGYLHLIAYPYLGGVFLDEIREEIHHEFTSDGLEIFVTDFYIEEVVAPEIIADSKLHRG